MKQILDHHAHDPVSRTRFVLEAEITGGLEHPGFVPVYGLGAYGDGRPFYAMRFIRGDSLKEAIARFHGKLATESTEDTEKENKEIQTGSFESVEFRRLLQRFIDVCHDIAYAHSRG